MPPGAPRPAIVAENVNDVEHVVAANSPTREKGTKEDDDGDPLSVW